MYRCECGYKFKKKHTTQQKYNNLTGQRNKYITCPQCGRKLNTDNRIKGGIIC